MHLKSIFLTLIASLTFAAVDAQQADTAKLVVRYQFTHVRDTLNKDKPYTENMMLLAGPKASVYKSYDRRMRTAQIKDQLNSQLKNNPGDMQHINIKVSGNSGSRSELFYFFADQKAYRKETLVNSYVLDEAFELPKWKISSDTATIGGLHCQKAATHFKGRDYEAWFCPDLPFHTGPWKLVGLPGLIVQAADRKNQVVFKFDGIEQADKLLSKKTDTEITPQPGMVVRTIGFGNEDRIPDNVIMLPPSAQKVNEKEFARLDEMMKKDPQAFMQASMAGSGMSMAPSGDNVRTSFKFNPGPQAPKPVVNNPLELTDGNK